MRQLRRAVAPLLALTLAGTASAAGAQPVTLTFEQERALFGSPGEFFVQVPQCYVTAGFVLRYLGPQTPACGERSALAFRDLADLPPGNMVFTNSAFTTTEFTRVDGRPFDLRSLDVVQFGVYSFGGSLRALDVVGVLAGGGTVTQRLTIGPPNSTPPFPRSLRSFQLSGSFTGLSALRIVEDVPGQGGVYGFDNLAFTVGPTVVPEPTTLALAAGGLALLGGMAARRRAR